MVFSLDFVESFYMLKVIRIKDQLLHSLSIRRLLMNIILKQMSQKLLSGKNPFKSGESFVKRIRAEVYKTPEKKGDADGKGEVITSKQVNAAVQVNDSLLKQKNNHEELKQRIFQLSMEYNKPQPYKKENLCRRNSRLETKKDNRQNTISQIDFKLQSNPSQYKQPDSIDKYLDVFFQNNNNIEAAMQMINYNYNDEQIKQTATPNIHLFANEQQSQQKQSQFDMKEDPFDFDALRQEQLLEQNEALMFVPQLMIAHSKQDNKQQTPDIVITQNTNAGLMLDLKFNVQMKLNTLSYKYVTRSFLTTQQMIKTKKYVLDN